MARKHKHEEHANHEAWAIPYGDLVTLLLAFFVVMYAISSVNEGKFRVLSDSLHGRVPRRAEDARAGPGRREVARLRCRHRGVDRAAGEHARAAAPAARDDFHRRARLATESTRSRQSVDPDGKAIVPPALGRVADEIEKALAPLVAADMIAVRRQANWVEVEIRTDILFASGVAKLSEARVAAAHASSPQTLAKYPNPVRVEGHTDNRPISTSTFPSNWELSAARAASVVHLFARGGVDPARLAVIGLGEFRPAQSNGTVAGRNANRRVLIVILGGDQAPEAAFGEDPGAVERTGTAG